MIFKSILEYYKQRALVWLTKPGGFTKKGLASEKQNKAVSKHFFLKEITVNISSTQYATTKCFNITIAEKSYQLKSRTQTIFMSFCGLYGGPNIAVE